jgi:hypothetical protein
MLTQTRKNVVLRLGRRSFDSVTAFCARSDPVASDIVNVSQTVFPRASFLVVTRRSTTAKPRQIVETEGQGMSRCSVEPMRTVREQPNRKARECSRASQDFLSTDTQLSADPRDRLWKGGSPAISLERQRGKKAKSSNRAACMSRKRFPSVVCRRPPFEQPSILMILLPSGQERAGRLFHRLSAARGGVLRWGIAGASWL